MNIDKRPEAVNLKGRLGDWGADTVIEKEYLGLLVTLTECVSKLELITTVRSKHVGVVT